MPSNSNGLNGLMNRWRARRAKLPWNELEAEAARQGCSPADIFFDRAGMGDPSVVAAPVLTEPQERSARPMPWRGLNPLPASR